jgi:hypothetical protein
MIKSIIIVEFSVFVKVQFDHIPGVQNLGA